MTSSAASRSSLVRQGCDPRDPRLGFRQARYSSPGDLRSRRILNCPWPLRGAPAQPCWKSLDGATGRAFGSFLKSFVGCPVHPLWLAGKRVEQARAAAQPHPYLLRPPDISPSRRLVLRLVGEAVASTAGEEPLDTV